MCHRLTRIQALTLNWVIENQYPVAQAPAEGYTVTYYEDLRECPLVAWPRICAALGLAHIPGEELVKAPSQQSYSQNAKNALLAREPHWRRALNADQLKEIQGILDATECNLYNVSSTAPLRGTTPPSHR